MWCRSGASVLAHEAGPVATVASEVMTSRRRPRARAQGRVAVAVLAPVVESRSVVQVEPRPATWPGSRRPGSECGQPGTGTPEGPARAVRATAAGGRRGPPPKPMTRRRYKQAEVAHRYVVGGEGVVLLAQGVYERHHPLHAEWARGHAARRPADTESEPPIQKGEPPAATRAGLARWRTSLRVPKPPRPGSGAATVTCVLFRLPLGSGGVRLQGHRLERGTGLVLPLWSTLNRQ